MSHTVGCLGRYNRRLGAEDMAIANVVSQPYIMASGDIVLISTELEEI